MTQTQPLLPLKSLSPDAVPRALAKAERYRLLNDPVAAESICLDILDVMPNDQAALVTLILALTDQFGQAYQMSETRPQDLIARLTDGYAREYYAGIIDERHAQSILRQGAPHAAYVAHDLLGQAMRHYDAAAEIRPEGNDDAILRWNTCARLMNSHGVQPRGDEDQETLE
jgi:hypothetical protein